MNKWLKPPRSIPSRELITTSTISMQKSLIMIQEICAPAERKQKNLFLPSLSAANYTVWFFKL